MPQVKYAQTTNRLKGALQNIVQRVVAVLIRSIALHRQYVLNMGLRNNAIVGSDAGHRRAQGNADTRTVLLGDGISLRVVTHGPSVWLVVKKANSWNYISLCNLDRRTIRGRLVYKLTTSTSNIGWTTSETTPPKPLVPVLNYIVRESIKAYNQTPVMVYAAPPHAAWRF